MYNTLLERILEARGMKFGLSLVIGGSFEAVMAWTIVCGAPVLFELLQMPCSMSG